MIMKMMVHSISQLLGKLTSLTRKISLSLLLLTTVYGSKNGQRLKIWISIYWALSIESNNSNISSLVVDMNGSIYSGNFHSYWRDAFGIIADYENEESDWKEYRYDPSETSIQKLYDDAPELYGQDRPLPPIVKTAGNPIFRNNFIQVSAYIESLGNNPDLIFGFQVSDSIFFDQAEEIIVQGNFAEGDLLETSFDFSYLEADRLYYRAFARNSLFESFGTKKRARMPVIENHPSDPFS
jgi:hypothetical protein